MYKHDREDIKQYWKSRSEIQLSSNKSALFKKKTISMDIFFFQDYHDAVFVVGSLDETLILRGMRYHPIDIENSVMRAHKKIAEW